MFSNNIIVTAIQTSMDTKLGDLSSYSLSNKDVHTNRNKFNWLCSTICLSCRKFMTCSWHKRKPCHLCHELCSLSWCQIALKGPVEIICCARRTHSKVADGEQNVTVLSFPLSSFLRAHTHTHTHTQWDIKFHLDFVNNSCGQSRTQSRSRSRTRTQPLTRPSSHFNRSF